MKFWCIKKWDLISLEFGVIIIKINKNRVVIIIQWNVFINIWFFYLGGGIAENSEFYDVCDELGVLVYQEFWMTGDNNGRWAGYLIIITIILIIIIINVIIMIIIIVIVKRSYDWPDDHNSYLENIKSVVVRLRNHPSLMMYAAGNNTNNNKQ